MSNNVTAVAQRVAEKRRKETHQCNRNYICEHILNAESVEQLQKAIWSAAHDGQFQMMVLRFRYYYFPVHKRVHSSVWNGLHVPCSKRWPLRMIRVNHIHEQLNAIVGNAGLMDVFMKVLMEKTCIHGVRYEWRLDIVAGRDYDTLYAVWT